MLFRSAILEQLAKVAPQLAISGVTRSHDLYGRMFQKLIMDRKFLATFYTLPPSATLLAELAVDALDLDWGDARQVKALRIADLACGTGTLLAAAYQAVMARYRRTGKNDADLHADMMAEALIAADIMPSATHLTTSMLSSLHPTRIFRDTKVYTLPYGYELVAGVKRPCIGALDLLDSQRGMDLFGHTPEILAVSGTGRAAALSQEELRSKQFALRHESLDLVIMNPPFTRPTNHAISTVPVPSFAGFQTSEQEQRAMAECLASLRRKLEAPAGNGYAGLASNFLDLADAKLRPGGVLALVLPLTFAQGGAWAGARALLGRKYTELRILSIASEKADRKSVV